MTTKTATTCDSKTIFLGVPCDWADCTPLGTIAREIQSAEFQLACNTKTIQTQTEAIESLKQGNEVIQAALDQLRNAERILRAALEPEA